jgi:AmiR/NasT family two-component response regulator
MIGNASEYGDSRRTALQLLDAAQSRELVDQAKGMLMQALGCTAAEALQRMRHISQQRNLKVTDVAARIIASGADGL